MELKEFWTMLQVYRKCSLRRLDLLLATAQTEAMRIDSSGNLLVGKTSAATNVEGGELRENGQVLAVATNVNPFFGARLGSDGSLAVFRKDTTTVGSIFSGHGGTQVGIGTNTTGITFNPATRSMMPANPSSTNPQLDATLDIGFSSVRWRDLYLSGGAYLGGTGASNKLDYYEEGTWTPTVAGCGITVGRADYTRIGNLVKLDFNFSITSTDNSGNGLQIGGRPFVASSANSESCGSLMINYYTATANTVNVATYTYSRHTYLDMYQTITGGGWVAIKRNQVQNSPATSFIGSITFITDT